ACRRFVYTENLLAGTANSRDVSGGGKPLQAPDAATPIIKKVITQMESEDGWVTLGEVGRQLANLASDFDHRTYGFRTLSDLVRRTNAFEIDQPQGRSMRIRIKSTAGSPPKARTARKPRREGRQSPSEACPQRAQPQQSIITGMAAVRFWYKAAGWLKTP